MGQSQRKRSYPKNRNTFGVDNSYVSQNELPFVLEQTEKVWTIFVMIIVIIAKVSAIFDKMLSS